ncbi:MAG: hypothetical protein KC486_11915, partial [Myxococcales bacterium]|nr:hypothetical protein [Myxococcales bacterium]
MDRRHAPFFADARWLPVAPAPLVALGAALVLACAPPRDLFVSPETLVFTPAATERTLTLRNPGAEALPLAAIRLDSASPDWGSFVL